MYFETEKKSSQVFKPSSRVVSMPEVPVMLSINLSVARRCRGLGDPRGEKWGRWEAGRALRGFAAGINSNISLS